MEQGLPKLTIACAGATVLPLDDLNDLQGNLKDLTEENYVKLRNSMLTYGFSFPIFYWEDNLGVKWIIDAHQRIRTLRQMRSEGYEVPPLPADPIFAKDRAEAKKKLLLLNSRFGKMTQEGFDEFTADLELDDLAETLVLDQVMFGDTPNEETTPVNLGEVKEVECPECGAKFTPKN